MLVFFPRNSSSIRGKTARGSYQPPPPPPPVPWKDAKWPVPARVNCHLEPTKTRFWHWIFFASAVSLISSCICQQFWRRQFLRLWTGHASDRSASRQLASVSSRKNASTTRQKMIRFTRCPESFATSHFSRCMSLWLRQTLCRRLSTCYG